MAKSWLPIPASSHFSLANIPFGIITTPSSEAPRTAVAIGDHVLDLAVFASHDGFSGLPSIQAHLPAFSQPVLNDFAALGRPVHREVRRYLQNILSEDTTHPHLLKSNEALQKIALFPLTDVQNHLPMKIWEYTDFFAGKNHAYNCGIIFRGPQNALQPNYTHLPVGYHSRASSIVVSGTPIRRPAGQILENPAADPKVPIFAPCRRLDIELELGAFLCKSSAMGEPIPIDEAEDYIFGYVLLNDWSARDIQQWEAIPLGPFNAKNFGSSVSAWVLLSDALEPFRTSGIENNTQLVEYLQEKRKDNVFSISLEVDLTSTCTMSYLPTAHPAFSLLIHLIAHAGNTTTVTKTNGSNLMFSFPQMLAHHSIGGCPMQVGDFLGSGTISGTEPGTQGSFLEQTNGGKEVVRLEGGEERKFLQDGDVITIRGWCGGEGTGLVGFGECVGRIEPSKF